MKKNLLIKLIEVENDIGQSNNYILDYLHSDLNKIIYSFGNHFKNPNENNSGFFQKSKIQLLILASRILTFLYSFKKRNKTSEIILSSAYFNIADYINYDFIIANPPWIFKKQQVCLEYNMYCKSLNISNKLNGDFKNLITPDFINLVHNYKNDLRVFVIKHQIRALFLPQDTGFFEKLSIDVFKELKLPTFNFIHGLPGIYNSLDYNRTDYLVVWGDAIKQNFVNAGHNPNKIIVNGHPKYKIDTQKILKFQFDDIVIITKSLNGSQFSDKVVLGDRSNLIYYLLSIQKTLKKFNVKSVRLRSHPSENIDWYYQFIDKNFFKSDTLDLKTSFSKASLVIGATSTTFLEALIMGVNFVVYEPIDDNGLLVDGQQAVSPFDGSHYKVPVAKNEIELQNILEKKESVDISILNDYISEEFKPTLILDLIANYKLVNKK